MKVCVQGLWHLGCVTAASLASVGHHVIGFDPNTEVIRSLVGGKAPVFEPGLDSLIDEGISSGLLRFTNDINEACREADLLWVTYDTPVDDDDIADTEYVIGQVKEALKFIREGTLVLISSQLPVGSIASLERYIKKFNPNKNIAFASSPENLRLGHALHVFRCPDRIIVGYRSDSDREMLKRLLFPVTNNIEWMSVESAEMTKHAINSFLATSVAFANEIATICELVGADAKDVERGLKTEARIGPKAYLAPGAAFAGGTLARDVEFIEKISQDRGLTTPLLSSIKLSNDEHKKWVQRKLLENFTTLSGLRVAVWGLTYKAGTDTLRRSLAVELVDWLIGQGAKVQVYDPAAKNMPSNWIGHVKQCKEASEGMANMQALVVATDWPEFKSDAKSLRGAAKPGMLVIDANGRLFANLADLGLIYLSVGSKRGD